VFTNGGGATLISYGRSFGGVFALADREAMFDLVASFLRLAMLLIGWPTCDKVH